MTPTLEREVVGIDGDGVTLKGRAGDSERIASRTVIWAAGVTASGLAARLGELCGAEIDRSGRVTVGPDLTLPGHPEVIALGDMVRVADGHGGVQDLPGVAPVAIQQGGYVAKAIRQPPRRPARSSPSGTATRATWPRSDAAVPWPIWASCASAGFPPG